MITDETLRAIIEAGEKYRATPIGEPNWADVVGDYHELATEHAVEMAQELLRLRASVKGLPAYEDAFGSTDEYIDLDIPRDVWMRLCEAAGVTP
jgi:hypothetical protein